jgi:hypothetical protein
MSMNILSLVATWRLTKKTQTLKSFQQTWDEHIKFHPILTTYTTSTLISHFLHKIPHILNNAYFPSFSQPSVTCVKKSLEGRRRNSASIIKPGVLRDVHIDFCWQLATQASPGARPLFDLAHEDFHWTWTQRKSRNVRTEPNQTKPKFTLCHHQLMLFFFFGLPESSCPLRKLPLSAEFGEPAGPRADSMVRRWGERALRLPSFLQLRLRLRNALSRSAAIAKRIMCAVPRSLCVSLALGVCVFTMQCCCNGMTRSIREMIAMRGKQVGWRVRS